MTAKSLLFHEAARERIAAGVDVLANAVKVRLGPGGRHVILQQPYDTPPAANSELGRVN